MNLKELKELIDIFTARESIEEMEVEKSGFRLKIKRPSVRFGAAHSIEVVPVPSLPGPSPVPAGTASSPPDDLVYVTAPIVGTFYKSPNPTSPPFVNIGDSVEKGTVLCIVEAMKLMNEIEAEAAGQVTAVFVDNGQPVEYGQKLFAIKRK